MDQTEQKAEFPLEHEINASSTLIDVSKGFVYVHIALTPNTFLGSIVIDKNLNVSLTPTLKEILRAIFSNQKEG